MDSANQIICQMTEVLLSGNSFSYPDGVNWEELLDALSTQAMESILYDFATLPCVPAAIKEKWQELATQKVFLWLQMMNIQKKMLSLLNEAGIPFVFIKGIAAGKNYPKPEQRPMGDIDALVKPADIKVACEVLTKGGFRMNDLQGHHAILSYGEILIELHYKYGSGLGGEDEQYLSLLLYEGIDQRETVTIEGQEFPILPSFYNGLIYLQHMANHMKSGLGLRQVLDWVAYIKKEGDQDFVTEKLLPAAKKLGLERLTKIVTKMGILYFGLSEEQLAWCADADEKVAGELLEYVMFRGNLGKNHFYSEKQALMEGKSPLSFLRTLQSRGKWQWKALEKHPGLTPFAWAYQLCHYTRLALGRKHAISATVADYKAAQLRRQFFEDLGLNEGQLPEKD